MRTKKGEGEGNKLEEIRKSQKSFWKLTCKIEKTARLTIERQKIGRRRKIEYRSGVG